MYKGFVNLHFRWYHWVPCSASGFIRTHCEQEWWFSPSQIQEIGDLGSFTSYFFFPGGRSWKGSGCVGVTEEKGELPKSPKSTYLLNHLLPLWVSHWFSSMFLPLSVPTKPVPASRAYHLSLSTQPHTLPLALEQRQEYLLLMVSCCEKIQDTLLTTPYQSIKNPNSKLPKVIES